MGVKTKRSLFFQEKHVPPSLFVGLWCLTPLSTIFQLYHGGQSYWWRKPKDLEKIVVHLALIRFELTTSVVIGTDCIGSCKSNYHTITATRAPPAFM